GVYYTYTAVIDGKEASAVDPYARTTGVNGKRAMVIDLKSTDPEGWEEDGNPHAGENITDAVIYELHVRDFSADKYSGMKYAGKYLAFTEETGIDYLKDLGITHLHLLPVYDFGSVDETKDGEYNWGYDPVNYNVPEGSYSTNPYRGEVRMAEFKQMVKSLHEHGISVVMDVVYNHVFSADDFCFNVLVPGYFSRTDADGKYSNGSDCGNDTASERSMVCKYIVDSVAYWADEYHIDGFRFDLVGLLDVDTINAIVEKVHESHPDVIFYGEGWSMDTHLTKDVKLATQKNAALTPEFAYFNDTIRDALKGSVFLTDDFGYVTGASGLADVIRNCFMAVNPWCNKPTQVINYSSCHDNMTLFAKIRNAVGSRASFADRVKMNNLAAAICILSEGVPFIMSGEEMLRTKEKPDGSFDANSYNSGDGVNAIRWQSLADPVCQQVHQYYKGLIAFRKAHPLLRLTSHEEIAKSVRTVTAGISDIAESADLAIAVNNDAAHNDCDTVGERTIADAQVGGEMPENIIVMDICGRAADGEDEEIYVIFNPDKMPRTVALPTGKWNVYVNADAAGVEVQSTVASQVTADALSATVLVRDM
ncbi:MAG: type I pullulanase, partial [Clostridiales bacterium]|nr:type I pullulanase [Clostridiales bacterium]